MGNGLTLVQTIITVVGSVTGAVIAAIIGAYLTHRLRKKDEDGSNPNEEQAHIQQGNRTTTNNQLSHQLNLHNRVALCCSNCHWIWGRRDRVPPPPVDGVATTASQSPSGVETTVPQAPPVETILQLMSVVPLITVGTWGYPKYGKNFNFNDLDDIQIIRIFSDSVINAIEVQYRKNQELIWTSRVGGDEGSSQEVVLEDGEYIIEVTGYYGLFDEKEILNSLTFFTNTNKKLGPYGSEEESKSTKFNVRGGKIAGFYGNAEKYIHAIGFYVLPVVDRLTMSSDVSSRVSLITMGPWGDPKQGDPFHHNGFNDIKAIKMYTGSVVDAIEVQYIRQGKHESTSKVGGHGGSVQPQVILEEGEYINEVTGCYVNFHGKMTINSLTFCTSRNNIFGPYGKNNHDNKEREPTTFSVKGGRIIGFHGTSGRYLHSIGFYVSALV